VLARVRYQRVTLVTDWGKHGGHTLCPALGFYVDQFGRSRHEYLTLFECESAKIVNIVAPMAKVIVCLEDKELNVIGWPSATRGICAWRST
jgi:hypothetical protein